MLFVASGTGVQETATLSPAERKQVITETIEAVDGRVPVLAGVSDPSQPIATETDRRWLPAGAADVGLTPVCKAVTQLAGVDVGHRSVPRK